MEDAFNKYFDSNVEEIKSMLLGSIKEFMNVSGHGDFSNIGKFVNDMVDYPEDIPPKSFANFGCDVPKDVEEVRVFRNTHRNAFYDDEEGSEEENLRVTTDRRARLSATFDDDLLVAYERKRAKLASPMPESKSDDDTTAFSEKLIDTKPQKTEDVAVLMETPVSVEDSESQQQEVKALPPPKRDEFGRLVSARELYPDDPKYIRVGPENLYRTVINDHRPSPNVKTAKGRFRWNKSTTNMANAKIFSNPFKDGKMSVRRARMIASVVALDYPDSAYCTPTMLRAVCIRRFGDTIRALYHRPDIIEHVKDENYRLFLEFLKDVVSG